jgi:hypothetical protein
MITFCYGAYRSGPAALHVYCDEQRVCYYFKSEGEDNANFDHPAALQHTIFILPVKNPPAL